MNAVSWSFITPPFQAPDEPAHFAYVEYLAQTGSLPSSKAKTYAADEMLALRDLRQADVVLKPQNHTIASRAAQAKLDADLASASSTGQTGAAGVATSQPPLYYALEALPYWLGSGGGVLAQLQLMRLLSALMAGLTALFAFLFVRETLPRVPWAWTVGGLGVAFAPLLGFMSGTVNPDAMLYATSAAVFYCLARAFRRGLTTRLAVTIGALTAVGLLTKLNFIGLVSGVILGLALLTVREARVSRQAATRSLAAALGIVALPTGLYVVRNLLTSRPALGIVSGAIDAMGGHRSLPAELSYIWQLYLPRLPGMQNDFPDISTVRDLWFNGFVGLYGWTDTVFPGWVYDLALAPAGLIAGACIREIAVRRAELRSRLSELGVYLAMAIGLMGLIGASSYLSFPTKTAVFPEPRYLLPLLPLLGVVLALAPRGVGRRWGGFVGALVIVLLLGHDLVSQLQVVARYYG